MGFAALPAELQLHIIEDSVRQPLASPSSTTSRHHALDSQQAANLARVSRSCYAIVTKLLYRDICLTTPSSLRELEATLKERPELATLVDKLHIGPLSKLPAKGWPVEGAAEQGDRTDCPLKTTLSDENTPLPRWCKPGSTFSIEHPAPSCQAISVDNAIKAATQVVDVEPWRRGWTKSETKIGVRAWAARLCLLQAALDVYLMEMRRIEDTRDYRTAAWYEADGKTQRLWSDTRCLSSACGHYPPLKILTATSERASLNSAKTFTVTEALLWEHILRRGGAADHFDHIVRLTCSTPSTLGATTRRGWWAVRADVAGPNQLLFRNHTWHRKQGGPLRPGCMHEYGDDYDSQDEDVSRGIGDRQRAILFQVRPSKRNQPAGHLNGHKVEDLLDSCASILGLTSNVTSLSLTSYMHRVLSSLCAPAKLRSAVLGPRTLHWDDALPAAESVSTFTDLRRLRIVGIMTEDDAAKIASCLPLLQDLEWEWPEDGVEIKEVDSILLRLQGQLAHTTLTEDDIEVPLKRNRHGYEEEAGVSSSRTPTAAASGSTLDISSAETSYLSPAPTSSRARVAALLHPGVAASVLTFSPLLPVKPHAWANGDRLPGTLRTVRVASSKAAVPEEQIIAGGERMDFDALYTRGRQWWEEG